MKIVGDLYNQMEKLLKENLEVKEFGNRSVVVKMTDVCNNKCKHCCFSCSPENTLSMDIEVAQKINSYFNDTTDVKWWFNLMGGELTLHPDYEKIIDSFEGRNIRLVTNGWWINNLKATERFVTYLKNSKATIRTGVSRDHYHPEKEGLLAYTHLMDLGFKDDFGLSTPDPIQEDKSIAMVGRAWWNEIGDHMLNYMQCYCESSNTRNTSYTVLEDGTVTYCPFGIIPIGSILKDTLEDLQETKNKIKKSLYNNMATCHSCYRNWEYGLRSKCIKLGYDIYSKTSL